MSGFQFGSEDHIECLQHLDTPTPTGESVCLAHLYTYHYVGLPAYVSDEGYVLSVEGSRKYYPLDEQKIHDAQQAGLLAQPLPEYSLSTGTYAWGFSLWPFLIGVVLLSIWASRRAKAKLRVQLAVDAATPVATTGPVLRTKGDRYIQDQLAKALAPGEKITHQAYGTNREASGAGLGAALRDARGRHGILAAWTGANLFLIETRIGAFGPLLENKRIETIPRARIREVMRADLRALVVTLDDGQTRPIIVDAGKKHFSNQEEFLRDLPRLLADAVAVPIPAPVAVAVPAADPSAST